MRRMQNSARAEAFSDGMSEILKGPKNGLQGESGNGPQGFLRRSVKASSGLALLEPRLFMCSNDNVVWQ